MNTPSILSVEDLRSQGWPVTAKEAVNNKLPKITTWKAVRPLGYQGLHLRKRIKAAWMVFTGRADVVTFE